MSIVAMSLRAVLFRRRVLAVALLPLLVAVIALVLRGAVHGGLDLRNAYAAMTAHMLNSLVTALVALMIGVNAFDDERDEGTLALLMATTLPRWQIVVAKFAAAWGATWLVCLPAVLACMVLGAGTDLPASTVVWSGLVASLVAAGGYVGLFVLLSLLVRRAVLVGLVYVVLWEGLLAPAATAFRNLSVGAFARRVLAAAWDTRKPPFSAADASVPVAIAWVLAAVLAALALSSWLLTRTRVN